MPANPRPPDDTGELDDMLHFVARDAIADLSTDDFLRAFQANIGCRNTGAVCSVAACRRGGYRSAVVATGP